MPAVIVCVDTAVVSGGGLVVKNCYEIRVIGSLGPAAREAFSGVGLEVEPLTTVLSGEFEQAELHALLDRVRALGLELVDVRQAPPQRDGVG
ncbi:MAG TPA: hypothetical protein VE442_23290 [Jatrophihabitans sp.]|nr:hypothetical protein [Jatrophihabitans sp.]